MVGEGGPVGPSGVMVDKCGVSAVAIGLGIEATRVRLKGFTVYKDRPTPLRLSALGDGLFDVDGSRGANFVAWRDGLVGLPDAEGREGEFGGRPSVARGA